MSNRLLVVATALFVAVAGGAAVAQAPAAPKSIWDGVYTEAQAARGAGVFATRCSNCHGPELQGDARFRALAGDVFQGRWDTRSVEALLNYVSKNMPNGNGGSLPPATYEDLIAFILSRNNFPAGTADLTAANALGVQIIGKDGARPLPDKTVAGIVGCLVKGGDTGWHVTSATSPRRLEDAKVPPEAGVEALGTGDMPLLFVLQSLDRMAGQRVFVRGLLIGETGVDGINVTEVRSVGPTCP